MCVCVFGFFFFKNLITCSTRTTTTTNKRHRKQSSDTAKCARRLPPQKNQIRIMWRDCVCVCELAVLCYCWCSCVVCGILCVIMYRCARCVFVYVRVCSSHEFCAVRSSGASFECIIQMGKTHQAKCVIELESLHYTSSGKH